MTAPNFTRVPPKVGLPPDGYDDDWTPLWLPRAYVPRSAAPEDLEEGQLIECIQEAPSSTEDPPDPILQAFMGAIYQARKRAAGTITRDDAMRLWERCAGRCEVSGIPFSLGREDRRFARRPWAPSIDQIEARKGYGLDNIRVVCIAVNYAMNHWGVGVLDRIVDAMSKRVKEPAYNGYCVPRKEMRMSEEMTLKGRAAQEFGRLYADGLLANAKLPAEPGYFRLRKEDLANIAAAAFEIGAQWRQDVSAAPSSTQQGDDQGDCLLSTMDGSIRFRLTEDAVHVTIAQGDEK